MLLKNLFLRQYFKKNIFNFYPYWIINDDIFIIFNYIFASSLYINNTLLKTNNINDFKLNIFIIPKLLIIYMMKIKYLMLIFIKILIIILNQKIV